MNFDEFEKKHLIEGSAKPTWQAFEQDFVKWWFLNDDLHDVDEYWNWQDWPDRSKHNFQVQDIGIDGVARLKSGELWAIQVKFRRDPDTPLGWGEVSTFFGLAARPDKRVFSKRVIVTNTWSPGHNLDIFLRSNPDSLWLGRQALTDSNLHWSAYFSKEAAKPDPKKPYPHQKEAIQSILSGLKTAKRGQVHMACGTGKTLVALWVREALQANKTLVLAPTLSLVRNLLLEWTSNRNEHFEFLTVCSDETVSHHDSLVEVASTLGIVTTTNPNEIADFLKNDSKEPKIIFSTYQSSAQIAKAEKKTGVPSFDLVICDEAHRTASSSKGSFSTVLDDNKIIGDHRLFMTATPRIYGKRVKARADENDLEIFSMDDELIYGPVLYEMHFAEAIERDLLCDYQVAVISVTDKEVREAIENRHLVGIDDHTLDAEMVATQVALGKAILKYKLLKIITFHGRVKSAKEFSHSQKPGSVSSTLTKLDLIPENGLWTAHVSGKMPAGDRARLLKQLEHRQETSIISNARCLTEGINVPALDAVAFIDPRQSKVDIVQAVGRAMRNPPGKEIGTIIIPLIIGENENPEEIIESSRFAAIADVLKALRSHDERLSETLDNIRVMLGKKGKNYSFSKNSFLTSHLIVDMPLGLSGEAISAKVQMRLVNLCTSNLLETLGILKQYISEHGWSEINQRTSVDGINLGVWVTNRRQSFNNGLLPDWLKKELESIPGWLWYPLADQHLQKLKILKNYVSQHGWSEFTAKTIVDGILLGRWVRYQKNKFNAGDFPDWLKKELESIPGWSWDPINYKQHRNLKVLKNYVSQHGLSEINQRTSVDGINLRVWVLHCRKLFRKDNLPDWLKKELESIPGWSWDPINYKHHRTLKILKNYVSQHGLSEFTSTTIVDGILLGRWISSRRHEFRKGTLLDWLKEELESIPGWSWTGTYSKSSK